MKRIDYWKAGGLISLELKRTSKTVAWIHKQAGLGRATVDRVLKGSKHVPTTETIKKLAEALGWAWNWRTDQIELPDDHPVLVIPPPQPAVKSRKPPLEPPGAQKRRSRD